MSAAKKDALKDSSYYLNDECMKPLKVSSKDFKAFDKVVVEGDDLIQNFTRKRATENQILSSMRKQAPQLISNHSRQ